jgi:hypothetical protein
MQKETCFESLDRLAAHFGSVSIQEKEDFYTHLKGYTDSEMAQAAFVIIDSRKWKSYPRVAEIRTVLDKIRFDARVGPTDEERDAYYDGLTCSACNGTGFVIVEKEGWPSGVAECCQCRIGRKREEGIGRYLDRKKMQRMVDYERRHEPAQGEERYD